MNGRVTRAAALSEFGMVRAELHARCEKHL